MKKGATLTCKTVLKILSIVSLHTKLVVNAKQDNILKRWLNISFHTAVFCCYRRCKESKFIPYQLKAKQQVKNLNYLNIITPPLSARFKFFDFMPLLFYETLNNGNN